MNKISLKYLMAQMWALDPQILATMKAISLRQIDQLSADDFKPFALPVNDGEVIGKRLAVRDGVGIIPVTGVVSRYASLFEDICGGTSTQNLSKDFDQALHDPNISGILFDMASPGGDARGIHEFAEMIYAARGQKPIIAYVGHEASSACYWLATACDEIVLDATAVVGSVGAVTTLTFTQKDADSDEESIELVSSQSPLKRADPRSDQGRGLYQQLLDDLADVFIDTVARNRDVDREVVLRDFGQGFVRMGQEAVDHQMADRLGSFEQVFNELKQGNSITMTETTTPNSNSAFLTFPAAAELSADQIVSELSAQRPDVMAQLSGEPPKMALDMAAEIVQLCADAGVPALSANLLKQGITAESATAKINDAKALKSSLAAAGMAGSFDTLLAEIDHPAKLVGMAVNDARSEAAESSSPNIQTTRANTKTVELNANDIYAQRNKR